MRLLLPQLRRRFNPRKLSGLSLWLDANDASSVLNSVGPDLAAGSGQTVRCWKDLSGNGRHLEQTTGSDQPTVLSNWKNGCRALSFDGVNDKLSAAIAPIPQSSGSTFTILYAAEIISAGGGIMCQGNDTAGNAVNDTFVIWRTGGFSSAFYSNGSVTNSANFSSDQIAAVRSIRLTSSLLELRRGGAAHASTGRSVTDPVDTNSFSVGRWFNWCAMSFAELLIYNRALSDAELVTAENYLRSKYGL